MEMSKQRALRRALEDYGSVTHMLEAYDSIMAPSVSSTTVAAIQAERRERSIRLWGADITREDLERERDRRRIASTRPFRGIRPALHGSA